MNPKGWVDDFRFPKYVYYLWQANFTQKPMVFIHPWPWQPGYIGKPEPITIDSNADSVELFVDGKGEVVPYIHPEIDWRISGEGSLVGPAKYTTDTDKNGAKSGTLYIVLPTANIVRTTSTAGEINVSVSSPGLEQASVTLRSTSATQPDDGIEQPELSERGRMPVLRDPAIVSTHPGIPPRVFDRIVQDYKLPASTPVEAKASMERFLHEHDPKLPKGDAAYQDTLKKLSDLLADSHGNLIADWYNFTADQYEDVAILNAAVERSSLPPAVRRLLEKDYADRILLQGETIDAPQEAKQLAALLEGAHVVSAGAGGADAKLTSASTVGDLLAATYPNWAAMDAQKKQRFVQLLYHFNPTLRELGAPALDAKVPSGPIVLPGAAQLGH